MEFDVWPIQNGRFGCQVCSEGDTDRKISQRRFTQAARCDCVRAATANVHDIDVRWHSCDMCEQTFKYAGTLKQHRAFVHDIDVRWHSCDMCEQKFKYASYLKRHRAAVHDIVQVVHASNPP